MDALFGALVLVDRAELAEKETVYNFEVGDSHTYFVGEFGAWVHNNPTCLWGGLSHAAKYGARQYGALRATLKGTGLQAHHLIEKRFAAVMGEKASEMLPIAVTWAEHQVFTNAWRAAIPYGAGTAAATQQQVYDAARNIYANHPAILSALGL